MIVDGGISDDKNDDEDCGNEWMEDERERMEWKSKKQNTNHFSFLLLLLLLLLLLFDGKLQNHSQSICDFTTNLFYF
jgi:hypothetical protein